MIDSPVAELSEFVRAYEAVQDRDGSAALEQFVPEPDHPQYRTILRELICVDLEYGWKRRQPRPLESYRERFPELFRDQEAVQEIAQQEYRLRLEAGERPTAEEYQTHGVDGAAWSDEPLPGTNGHDLVLAATSYQEIRPQGPEEMQSWVESFHGRPEHADLFLEMHRSDPEAAGRLAEAVTAMPEVGTEFLGFRLLEALGEGAFAHVFLCQQGELANRYVVLKISPQLDTEPQTLAQLQHTNVMPVYSVHRAGALQAVCMPFFGSITLATVIKELQGRDSLPASGGELISTLVGRHSTLRRSDPSHVRPTADPADPIPGHATGGSNALGGPSVPAPPSAASNETANGSRSILEMLEGLSYVEAVLWIMKRVAEGLGHAHEHGILHRDLKPANILLTDEGQPMLLDFNLAQDTKLLSHPAVALIGGTLPFMAPEQLEAYRTERIYPERRSDIYALGVIFYELLTGRHPFPARSGPLHEVLAAMVADRLHPPPGLRRWNKAVPPAVESIVRHCLEPELGRRYQNVRELQEDLERQFDNRPLKHAPEPSLAERAHKWMRRHPRISSSSSVAVIAAVALVILGCSWLLHVQRLARLEAVESLHEFQEEMRSAQFILTTRAAEPAQFEAGMRSAREALHRYAAIDNPSWLELPAVRRLPDEDRTRLRQDVGDLLLLLAQATSLRAGGCADRREQEDQFQFAWHLNERAEACYGADKTSRALLLQRAELASALGQESEAQRLGAAAAAAPLRTPTDHYLLATEHVARGRFREAIPLLQEANQQDPQHFWAWFTLGNCYDNLSQDAEALASYSASMGLRPKFPWSYFNRGLVHLRQQNLKQASADFDQVVQLRPDLADAYVNRALARQGLGNYAGAIDDLTTALKLGAPYTRIYFMLARVRDKAGDKDGARRDWEEGLRQEPTDEKSWLARGMARLSKDEQGALTDFEKALEFNSRSLAALQNKAHVLSKLGRNQEAVEVLDATIRLHPDYGPARIGRGVILARLGKRDAALRDAAEVLLRENKAALLYQAACIHALTSRQEPGDRREAYRLLASALWKGYGLEQLDKDKDLEPIRNEPEFRRLADEARSFYGSMAGKILKP